MHCPGCGQQQVSNETKLCSRCGLPLGVVSELLVHGGFLPQLEQLNQNKKIFTKKNGVISGTFWLIFLAMFSTAFLGILGAPGELIGIVAITGVLGAMMIILASLLFLPSSKPTTILQQYQTPPPPSLYGAAQQTALPPPQSIPASAYAAPRPGTWRDTNDLEPTSVTEGTTKLLERDDLD